jgi:hypothetical protein
MTIAIRYPRPARMPPRQFHRPGFSLCANGGNPRSYYLDAFVPLDAPAPDHTNRPPGLVVRRDRPRKRKRCSLCQCRRPRTGFSFSGTGTMGLHAYCKYCRRKYRPAATLRAKWVIRAQVDSSHGLGFPRARFFEYPEQDRTRQKDCTACHESYPAVPVFFPPPRGRGPLGSWCMKCRHYYRLTGRSPHELHGTPPAPRGRKPQDPGHRTRADYRPPRPLAARTAAYLRNNWAGLSSLR